MRRRALAGLIACFAAALAAACTAEMKARAYAGDDRDAWQQPERVVDALGLAPGQSVADLGAGGGYFTFRLADRVGERGRVYAVDVDAQMNERLAELAREAGAAQVEVVLADFDDPKLPEPVDWIFTSNTYHHLDDRVTYFRRAARYLAPGGRLAVIEFVRDGFFHRVLGHGTDGDTIRGELERAGYTLVASHDFLDRQSFQIFAAPATP